MDINLEYYKIFYYVGTKQSITLAAEELSISQPAVSQAIKNIEQAYGCKLFARVPKGVRFTAEGEVLFSYVKKGYETILAGDKRLNEMLNLESGEIRIGASDMTLKYYILSYLEKFHELHPEIKVTVTNAPTPETISCLSDGEIDFGVVSTPFNDASNIKKIPVKEIRDIFVAGNRFSDLKGKKISYKDLEKMSTMCLEGHTSTRQYVTSYLKKFGAKLKPEFELATSDMLVQFAKRNLGIASVVEDFAKEELENGELFELKFEEEIPKRKFCIVLNEKLPMSTAAKELISAMLDNNYLK
ncbi:LysR family transcriptional regulator [Lachnobacterium bovis]|jgi:DNA-binding transcriptional LysR family regulator|uniref:DNA-binding transcriptional regulator, LysR family n=1 Tax=Lachnobacterium bovis DSM 14045 TaxID=1122142 RepID=A0A1H3GU46_9FIRM|nr:LysR family transcriptional regulator [Lachnobacterium bovis]MBQ1801717.1 LysR family transcriptional regulator [Lachnobacterium sp.]SDY06852.1 DNA-binding transcriptional regulator, LysR family [Lachnobacterium bovis DSM 14045]